MAALSNSWWQISSTVDNEVEEMVIVVTVLHCWSNTVNSFRIASCGVLEREGFNIMLVTLLLPVIVSIIITL